jgi:branched-chain amino acid transport system permease protein
MALAVDIIVNTLMLSSMYVVVALGFAVVFSIMSILNFAHGAIYMIGGYICYQFAVTLGLNQWLSLVLSVIIVGAFGLFLERFCFRPFGKDMYRTIVMAITIAMVLQTIISLQAGTQISGIPAFATGYLSIGPTSVSMDRLVTFIIGGALLVMFRWLIARTKLGWQMQAIAQDQEGASLQGIHIHRVSALAFVFGCGLAATAGSLMGAILSLGPFMGEYMLLKAIEVVILGGIGSITGVFAGGLMIGAIDACLPQYIPGAGTQAAGLGIIIVLLLFRPQGFFGRIMD